MCAFFHKISALILRAQASEVLLEELQQGLAQAKRDVREQMVSDVAVDNGHVLCSSELC